MSPVVLERTSPATLDSPFPVRLEFAKFNALSTNRLIFCALAFAMPDALSARDPMMSVPLPVIPGTTFCATSVSVPAASAGMLMPVPTRFFAISAVVPTRLEVTSAAMLMRSP